MRLRPGQGNANFIADAVMGVPYDEMARRHERGEYGKLRPDYAEVWFNLAGRKGETE